MLLLYPNINVDTGAVSWLLGRPYFHELLHKMIWAGFGKRIMFGSDQMVWPDAIGLAIAGVDQAPFLSAEQKRDIFYNNAATFLHLDQRAIDRHHGR
jgi:predicted TIM-barrel fold metal-dependent hydrolase